MRVLQIGADRSKRGVLVPGSPAYLRQKAYAGRFGKLDIIGYSLRSDGFVPTSDDALNTYPTNAPVKLLYGTYALRIARTLPKPEVISAQDPHVSGLLALMIARWHRVPLHVQVHTDLFDKAYISLSLMNRVQSLISRFVLKRADGIRVVSSRIKDSIELWLTPKNQITVLPIYVDIDAFANYSPDTALAARFGEFSKRLVVISRLEPEKNVSLAIDAFADQKRNDICLIVVGSGSEKEALVEQAHERRVADRVFFEGEHDPKPYYALADLVLVPSHYEGYGLVIIEALASKTPVLSTDVGIAREVGAIVAQPDMYAAALGEWLSRGPREAMLNNYPYENLDQYVHAYCDDVARCVTSVRPA